MKTTVGPVRIEAGFLTAMAGRGQRGPTLVISDGAPGLLAAVESVFPHSLTQRCLIHRARNLVATVPLHGQAEVKAVFWNIFDDNDVPPGKQAVRTARSRALAFPEPLPQRVPRRAGVA